MRVAKSPAKSEAWLCGVSVLIVSGALLGPSMTYLIHAVAFIFACRLLFLSEGWRTRTAEYFREPRGVWGLMLAFAIVFALPFVFSSFSSPDDLAELKWVLCLLGLLIPGATLLRSDGNGKILRSCFLFLSVLVVISALNGLAEFVTFSNPLRELLGQKVDDFGRRATGLLRNPIPFGHAMGGLFWIASAGVVTAWLQGAKKTTVLAAVIALAAFSSVLVSQTRGAWLAVAIVSVLSIFPLTGKARTLWLGCLGAALVAGLILLGFSADTRNRLLSGFDSSDRSNNVRLELWQANFEILKDHPFGIGYNANDKLIGTAFDKLGFYRHEWMGHSHNEFVEIGVGSGWLGLVLYLWLSGWLLWRSVKTFRGLSIAENSWASFLLLSSILLQLFINACALTDQMSTPGRYLLCFAWAIAIVAPVELKSKEEASRESTG